MTDPLAPLDAHRARVTALLDALPPAVVHQRPAPDAWSLAQLAEHFVLIDGGLRFDGPPASALARATSGVRSRAIRSVLALPLRIKGPPSAQYVMPTAAPRWPEVRERWAALRAGWRRARPAPGAVGFDHPIAGPFLFDDALAFLLAHHRHHDAQIRRTLKALGVPVGSGGAPSPAPCPVSTRPLSPVT